MPRQDRKLNGSQIAKAVIRTTKTRKGYEKAREALVEREVSIIKEYSLIFLIEIETTMDKLAELKSEFGNEWFFYKGLDYMDFIAGRYPDFL